MIKSENKQGFKTIEMPAQGTVKAIELNSKFVYDTAKFVFQMGMVLPCLDGTCRISTEVQAELLMYLRNIEAVIRES